VDSEFTMTFLHREPAAESATGPEADNLAAESATDVPLTRTGAAWIGVSAAALIAILLIVFLVQNTHRVRVNFLWMSTSTSLALMLLIAAVGAVLITVILGTARIVQLRRLIRGRGTR
jgi:uncharacterized integral membrane protein